jgi:hypothetical protein
MARPSSGFYGVSASKKRWQACIYYGGKLHSLGNFDTKEEAALDIREEVVARPQIPSYDRHIPS